MSSFFLLKLVGEKRLVKSVKLLSLSVKSINPIQKYPHITELHACILKIYFCMFLLPVNLLITFRMCSTPKLSKYVISEQSNKFQYLDTHQDLLHMPHILFY